MKDPLGAATRSVLRPFMRAEGFVQLTRRSFVRVEDCVAQLVHLQVSSWGGGGFCVNYAANTICFPFEAWALTYGARLRSVDGRRTGWEADSRPVAEAALWEVVAAFQAQARPFFESCRTAAGMIEVINASHQAHHAHFERGCCEVWLGRLKDARSSLARAAAEYTADYRESNAVGLDRSWCIGYKRSALRLLRAIDEGRHEKVLRAFFRKRWGRLGLDKVGECPV